MCWINQTVWSKTLMTLNCNLPVMVNIVVKPQVGYNNDMAIKLV